jgi:hypothetical protein
MVAVPALAGTALCPYRPFHLYCNITQSLLVRKNIRSNWLITIRIPLSAAPKA